MKNFEEFLGKIIQIRGEEIEKIREIRNFLVRRKRKWAVFCGRIEQILGENWMKKKLKITENRGENDRNQRKIREFYQKIYDDLDENSGGNLGEKTRRKMEKLQKNLEISDKFQLFS